jgi:hypothetical protein
VCSCFTTPALSPLRCASCARYSRSAGGDDVSEDAAKHLAEMERAWDAGKSKLDELTAASDDKFDELWADTKEGWESISSKMEEGWAGVSEKFKSLFS